jgi:hypothetical protein
LHSALSAQGRNVVQGFLHSPFPPEIMHACLLGHSLSIWQPRSSAMTRSGVKENIFNLIIA